MANPVCEKVSNDPQVSQGDRLVHACVRAGVRARVLAIDEWRTCCYRRASVTADRPLP